MEQKQIVARTKGVLEVDGLRFKDLDGTGELKPYEDWRLSPEERAKDLVGRMTDEEKAGMLIINSQPMGISSKPGQPTSHNGVLAEAHEEVMMRGHKNMQYPTTYKLATRHIRHFIVRENASASWLSGSMRCRKCAKVHGSVSPAWLPQTRKTKARMFITAPRRKTINLRLSPVRWDLPLPEIWI